MTPPQKANALDYAAITGEWCKAGRQLGWAACSWGFALSIVLIGYGVYKALVGMAGQVAQ